MDFRIVRGTSIFFIACGLFGLLSFGLATSGASTGIAILGDILFKSFHLAGLYAVIYLLSIGLSNWRRPTDSRRLAMLSLGFVPAIFLGLTLRLMFTDVSASVFPALMQSQFGFDGAVFVAGFLTLLSFACVVLGATLLRPNPVQPDQDQTRAQSDQTAKSFAEPQPEPSSQPEVDAVQNFRAGIAGLLESKLRQTYQYPDLGELHVGLGEQSQTAVQAENSQIKRHLPQRPIPLSRPVSTDLPIYFSSDGSITDYPPPDRQRWTVVMTDETKIDKDLSSQWPNPVKQTSSEPTADPLSTGSLPPIPSVDPPLSRSRQSTALVESPALAKPAGVLVDLPAPVSIGYQTYPTRPEPNRPAGAGQDRGPGAAAAVMQESPAEYAVADSELETEELETEADMFQSPALDEESSDATVDTNLLPPLGQVGWIAKGEYAVPVQGLLNEPENKEYWLIDQDTTRAAAVLKDTLQEFGIQADVTGIRKGPVITMFEILPAHGVKLNRIVNLSDNIALRLAAQSVRIVAPIPGKHAVGIEIPNRERVKVSFSELLAADSFWSSKIEIPVALGKDITGDAQIIDLTKTPHLLIAGSTGSGKSVSVNALICSILYRRSPAEVNLILIDPKIVELKFYNDIPHLLTPVITDPKRAFQALQWCLYEMERRYSLLDVMQVRDIKSYNTKVTTKKIATATLPYLVIIIDEFADLMAASGKELEGTLARLAAMSRAVGIHLVLATQRPSTDVITGLIKANIPSRIAFMVASKIDSRIIIDSVGAEKLLGRGDMLFTSALDPFPVRIQGAFLSEDEVERVVAHVKTLGVPDYIDSEIFFDTESDEAIADGFDGADDPLLQQAIDIVVGAKKASASYLQRRLKIGYNRAARMVEQMEEMGIVGPAQGSKPRDILRMYQ